ncbi:unnamed protein product [Symbiodinium sp. CCMP2592]|nr:unnamed protein product [Symbiodinium sp. CCMP2592]
MPLILPHELMVQLSLKGHLEQGLEDATKKYWSHMEKTGSDHPCIHDKMCRPLGLYGDDAQYDRNCNKLIVVTLSDCLATSKHSMAATWPLFVLREGLSIGFDTLNAFLAPVLFPIAISLNILFYGRVPASPLHLETEFTRETWENVIKPNLKDELLFKDCGDDPKFYAATEVRGDWKFVKVQHVTPATIFLIASDFVQI